MALRYPAKSFGQRGEGRLGCILWTALLVVAVMIAWKMVPIKIASADLEAFMDEQAKFSAKRSSSDVKKAILKKAEELDLPLDAKELVVQKTEDHIKMRATYTVPVEFPGYTYDWDFEVVIDRDIFYF